MIWEYRDASDPDEEGIAQRFRSDAQWGFAACPFCATSPMRTLSQTSHRLAQQPELTACEYSAVHVCDVCGWWNAMYKTYGSWQEQQTTVTSYDTFSAAWGVLKKLTVADVSAPTSELIEYLIAKYGERFAVHPRKFEEIVAAVFGAAGYSVRVTASSGDAGIDLIVLDGPGDCQVGIQVKRYASSREIEAEQIRSLAGALMLHGLPRGVFVTTSAFRRGATLTADRYLTLGLPIELIDAARFYDRLQLTRRSPYSQLLDPSSPYLRFVLDADNFKPLFSNTQVFEIGHDGALVEQAAPAPCLIGTRS